jgi:DnaD/phage-associated family protein
MTPAQHELRRIIGFRGRNVSRTEKEYLRRWSEDYCYSTTIVEEAFCLATESGAVRILPYMDKLLKKWHDAGCVTLEDCRRKQAEDLAEKEAKAKERETEKENKTRRGRKDTAKTPKYTEFDSEDALMKALARSYGDSDTGTQVDTPPTDGDEN